MAGILYLCATPIGNLEDISLRVLRTLREVDLIAAEDTRNSIKLLNHFEIKVPMTSYHEFNKIETGMSYEDVVNIIGANERFVTVRKGDGMLYFFQILERHSRKALQRVSD